MTVLHKIQDSSEILEDSEHRRAFARLSCFTLQPNSWTKNWGRITGWGDIRLLCMLVPARLCQAAPRYMTPCLSQPTASVHISSSSPLPCFDPGLHDSTTSTSLGIIWCAAHHQICCSPSKIKPPFHPNNNSNNRYTETHPPASRVLPAARPRPRCSPRPGCAVMADARV